jgi:hypothetical protein
MAYDILYRAIDPATGDQAWVSVRNNAVMATLNNLPQLLTQIDASGWEVVAVGDLNGDGTDEILISS